MVLMSILGGFTPKFRRVKIATASFIMLYASFDANTFGRKGTMTTQSTIDKLIEMRPSSMSDAFLTQMQDPKTQAPLEDRFGMLLDIEYSNRKTNSLKRLIRNAGFDQPDAYIGDINYTSGRKLNRALIERLTIREYITEHRNLFITGATGSGKTYLACAFRIEARK